MSHKMSKFVRLAGIALLSAGLGFTSVACHNGMHDDTGTTMTGAELSKPDKNIIQIATGDNMGDVSTLVKAVEAAGLVDTLQGPGPFTVFAPTNEAFAKLPPGTLDMLLKPENKDKLRDILLYHVLPGKVMAADVKTMSATMADNKTVAVSVSDGTVMLNGTSKVIKPDIIASNGVIHWVDTVLMPPN